MPRHIITALQKANLVKALVENCVAQTPGAPHVYAMAGIPGAGKTTFVEQALKDGRFPSRAFIMNPDRVLHAIPEAVADIAANGYADAFARWEMPVRVVTHELADLAMDKRCDIIVDMGQVREENWDYLHALRLAGYHISLFPVFAPIAVCKARIKSRTQHFPSEQVSTRAEDLATLLRRHAGDVDVITAFDNSDLTQPFRPINDWQMGLAA